MVMTPLKNFEFEVVTVDAFGQVKERETKEAKYFTEDLDNGITLDMVAIPEGKFKRGAPENEKGSSTRERPQDEVKIQSFFMGKFPVTQGQWRAIATPPLNPEQS
ncbi:MAG: formylglycine-generating enzyme family protein, partial [Prochloraceae cyanobacterium]